MKMSLGFVALAGAVAPPRIELNLEGMTSAYKLNKPIMRDHHDGTLQNNGDPVLSRQDWTEKCAAKLGDNKRNDCPFPVAAGFDHQDRKVDVVTRIFKVDVDGEGCNDSCELEVTTEKPETDIVNFKQRSTYLFKYDATDTAGNHAEQVVFALILDDTTAPQFNKECSNDVEPAIKFEPAITVQAVSDWVLCDLEAVDNIDETNIDASTYGIVYLGRDHAEFNEGTKEDFFFKTNHKENLSSGSTYDEAKNYFTPKSTKPNFGPTHVGKFLVTISTVDKAGVYGHNAQNNVRDIQQAILIRDSESPTIYIGGSNPTYVECRKKKNGEGPYDSTDPWDFEAYKGSESDCKDALDTVALGRYLPVTTTHKTSGKQFIIGPADNSPGENEKGRYPRNYDTKNLAFANLLAVKGKHILEYTCDDYSGNNANPVDRTVSTVDTHQPTLTLTHDGKNVDGDTHKVIYQLDDNGNDDATDVTKIHSTVSEQATCEDSCDADVRVTNSEKFSMSWGPREFNAKILGDYVRTYTCSDADKNIATKTRTYTVIDNEKPIIEVIKPQKLEVPADRDSEYTDLGATCHDFVDGELSHAVEVSGEVVNLRIPGVYIINYDCQDLSGNEAVQQTRTVTVVDKIKPRLTLLGKGINYVEAGFPYVDMGATATDDLDGDITQYIWTDGNTVKTSNAFYSASSCREIFNKDKSATNGMYEITVQKPSGIHGKQKVHCFEKTMKDGPHVYTYFLHKAGNDETCEDIGMKRTNNAVIQEYDRLFNQNSVPGNQDEFYCTVSETTYKYAEDKQRTYLFHEGNIGGAESGRYVIHFNVEDKAGNPANQLHRTVIVKDTLPPVITLHLNNKLVHASQGTQQGVMTQNPAKLNMINPAGYKKGSMGSRYTYESGVKFGNPNLMAESTSTNGWLIGAVASAVAGVALLGFSARKSTVISVPV